jgi:hypothetical protein
MSRQIDDERSWEQVLREFSPTASSFIGLVECLIQSDQQIKPVFSLPGPIANQTILSPTLAFSESESVRSGYICSPSKKRKVQALLAAVKEPDELSRVAEIIGSQDNDLIEMMNQSQMRLGPEGDVHTGSGVEREAAGEVEEDEK